MAEGSARIEVQVGPVAHGGFCVARHEGRVMFVRHALPGERVRVAVTEDSGGSYSRADAVEILDASPDRVPAPCPHAGPGRCGGCDWQHTTPDRQRALKADVIREQFARLAGLGVDVTVAELPGGPLGWRTRILYAVDQSGRPGLHRHRSPEIEPIDACPLGVPGVGDSPVLHDRWPGLTGVEVVATDADPAVLAHRPGPGRQARGRRPPDRVEVLAGPARVTHEIDGQSLSVATTGFWQVHPDAAATFSRALLEAVAPQPGESVLDVYCGAGALTVALAEAVGPTGRVLGLESDAAAVADAQQNLAGRPWADVRRERVTATSLAALAASGVTIDLVVLDPPRAGAGIEVMAALLDLRPRAVGYVSCDPATLARDVRVALDRGWRLDGLRAFDAFPMTHHVECVAALVPPVS